MCLVLGLWRSELIRVSLEPETSRSKNYTWESLCENCLEKLLKIYSLTNSSIA